MLALVAVAGVVVAASSDASPRSGPRPPGGAGPEFLPIAAHGLAVPRTIVGRWSGPTPTLPDPLIPRNPLLGNGYTGAIVQSGLNMVDINLNTNGMWSVRDAHPADQPPTAKSASGGTVIPPVPTARRAALGGVTVSVAPGLFANCSAEQQIGVGQLIMRQVSPRGLLTTTVAMHPQQQVILTNVSWTGAGPLAVDFSTWAAAGLYLSKSTLNPFDLPPASTAACCNAAGVVVSCKTATTLHCVSRNASGYARTPRQIWAGLATRFLGGERGSTTARYNVTKSSDHLGLRVSSTTTSFLLQPGDALSAVTALRTEAFAWDATPPISAGGHSPLPHAAALATATSPSMLSVSAEESWRKFWLQSAVSTPSLPELEYLW